MPLYESTNVKSEQLDERNIPQRGESTGEARPGVGLLTSRLVQVMDETVALSDICFMMQDGREYSNDQIRYLEDLLRFSSWVSDQWKHALKLSPFGVVAMFRPPSSEPDPMHPQTQNSLSVPEFCHARNSCGQGVCLLQN